MKKMRLQVRNLFLLQIFALAADYGFKISIDKKEAKYILQGSQKFLNECELILKSKMD